MNLYPKNDQPFDEALFRNPTEEYRGAPFWSWNTKLKKSRLKEQIAVLQEMGMGGFHIHSRIGLDTEYLGRDFMEAVKFCCGQAEERHMRCWLYDEDKWPSGYGAGRVTADPKYRNRFLLFSPEYKPDGYMKQKNPQETNRLAIGGDGRLLARYEVELRNGYLESYRRLQTDENGSGNIWYAYLVIAEPSPWFNNQAYGDTLNPEATKEFIRQVHEKYREAVGDRFAGTIPAIFTDEPQFSRKDCFARAEGKEELKIPFTEDLEEGFQETYGVSLLDSLPELFWELPGAVSKIRYWYHDYVAERFAQAYSDTLGRWCREHGILLTGHMMEEPELGSQTRTLGEAMRQYRNFGLPGIDMLADAREYTTAKQAQSASHQYGCQGVLSELYGVTNWDFDFRGHKLQGDWQAALGVTQRVHHLSWLSMRGESKRDYPAPIDEHSPWYKKYHYVEDYFARIHTAMTRGKASVRVGVIHPAESYWISYGPNDQTGLLRESLEEDFRRLTEWLLFGLLDFDYICESQLPVLYEAAVDGKFHVGQMAYDVVVVPHLRTMRSTTRNRLWDFQKQGGTVLWIGGRPEYLDAEPAGPEAFAFGRIISFERAQLYQALEPWRDLSLTDEKGEPVWNMISQMRQEQEERWLFLAVGTRDLPEYQPKGRQLCLKVRGEFGVQQYDPLAGTQKWLHTEIRDGWTWMTLNHFEDDSILLRLRSHTNESVPAVTEDPPVFRAYLRGPVKYRLSEPNVLLLDQVVLSESGSTDGEKEEEILKAEDQLRRRYGYRLRSESFPQPWLEKEKTCKTKEILLTYTFASAYEADHIRLAAEAEPDWEVSANGEICRRLEEFWLDEAFVLYELPVLKKGENTIGIRLPFGKQTALERCFLLGDFGVETDGMKNTLTKKPETLQYGDITRQQFPFYGGNLTYLTELHMEQKQHVYVQVPDFAGALVSVRVAGKEEQPVFCAPYMADLGVLDKGEYPLEITCFGNRYNQFGQLHSCNRKERYYGPWMWRTEGADWSKEYQLKPAGILSSPLLYR